MTEKPKKEEVKKEEAKIIDIVSETALAIQLEDGKQVTPMELQVAIYNKLLNIEKAVA